MSDRETTMSGCIVQVWPTPEGRASWDNAEFLLIETDCADFDEVMDAMASDGFITGSKLFIAATAERGVKTIRDRRPVMLARACVARAELPSWSFVELQAA